MSVCCVTLSCPGCHKATMLDQPGMRWFDLGSFHCEHCGACWQLCPNPDCYADSPECAVCGDRWGWVPSAADAARGGGR